MSLSLLVLVGAGGHAGLVAEIIAKAGCYQIVGYTAPEKRLPGGCWNFKHLGDDTALPALRREGVVLAALGVGATGDNRPRAELYRKIKALGFSFPALLHPAASVAVGVQVSEGAVIAPGVVINPGAVIGANVIVNSAAVVEHDCVIGAHVHLAPGTVLCGGVRVGDLAHVGAGAVVIQGVAIGEGAIVGAGAVVLADVEPWTVVAGNPARTIRKRREEG